MKRERDDAGAPPPRSRRRGRSGAGAGGAGPPARAARTSWRDVPDGPRSDIVQMLGMDASVLEVERLGDARALRDLFPEARTALTIRKGLGGLLMALDLAAEQVDTEHKIVQTLATQDVCDALQISQPSKRNARLVGQALCQGSAQVRELQVSESKSRANAEAIIASVQHCRSLREVTIASATCRWAPLGAAQCASLGQALRAESCALRKLAIRRELQVDALEQLVEGLGRNRTLHELRLFIRVTPGDVIRAATALGEVLRAQQVPLRLLFLQSSSLDDASAAALAMGLARNQTLVELSLQLCGLGMATGTALGDVLRFDGSKLAVLRLSFSLVMDDAAGAALAEGLATNKTLRELHLHKCDVGVATATALGVALAFEGSGLQVLKLNCNKGLNDAAGAALARGLQRNSALRELILSNCGVAFATCAALGQALAFEHSAIQLIDLESNRAIGDAGGAALARGMARNAVLRELNLSRCRVGSGTASTLAQALQFERSALRVLNLANNSSLGSTGGAALAKGLQRNSVLRQLNLYECKIAGGAGLEAALAVGPALRSLQVLDLGFNQGLGDAGVAAVARALARNSVLRTLHLGHCNAGLQAATALAEALAFERSALRQLMLQGNLGLGDAGGLALAAGIKGNAVLHTLNLHGCKVSLETVQAIQAAAAAAAAAKRPALRVLHDDEQQQQQQQQQQQFSTR